MKEKKSSGISPAKLQAASVVAEPLENAGEGRAICQKCALFKTCNPTFQTKLEPENWTGKLVLVLPTLPDHKTDEGFKALKTLREKAGYSHADVAYVGAVRCRYADVDSITMSQIRACRSFLLTQLSLLNPNVVIGVGPTAYRALSNYRDVNVTKARGKPITIPGFSSDERSTSAYVTYSPDELLKGKTHLEADIVADFQRVSWPRLAFPAVGLPATDAKALDTEFDPEGNLITVGLANNGLAEALDTVGTWKPIISRSLRETRQLIGHNLPGDIDMLVKNQLPLQDRWLRGYGILDSLLLARMVNENRSELGKGAYSLGTLMLSEFNVPDWKAETDAKLKENPDARLWTPQERTQRCKLDAWASYVLAKAYYPRLEPKLVTYLHRVAMTLHRVGLAGAKVDRARFSELGDQWSLETAHLGDILTRQALQLGMTEFIPTNKNHVRELVTEKLGLPLEAKTKTGLIQVDKISLKKFADNETIQLLLEYSKSQKLASTWYGGGEDEDDDGAPRKKSIGELIDEWGLLHFWINALGARTGRRSSGGGDEGTPESRNSQNWPIIARSIIVSRFPGGKIGAHDYKSLEPVLYGWIAKDERLLDYFVNGGGYIDIAKEVLRKEVVKDTPEYKLVKSMTLGTFYNMGDWKLAKDLWEKLNIKLSSDWDTHLRLVGEMRRNRFFPLFPGLEGYIHKQIREMERTQQVVAPDGFVRHLPHHGAPDRGASRKEKGHWKHLQNTAVNFPVQHMASMVTGSALIDIEAAILKDAGISYRDWHEMLLASPLDLPRSVIINEVHDEVTTDYKPESYERDKEIVFEIMKTVPSLKKLVPAFTLDLKLEAKIGSAWAVNEEQ